MTINLNTQHLNGRGSKLMTKTKSTTKGQRSGKAGGDGESMPDAAFASAILALAFRTKAERDDARKGVFMRGSMLEDVADLATELAVQIIHPEVLPHALPVILREARAHVGRRGRERQTVSALLLKLERAATGVQE